MQQGQDLARQETVVDEEGLFDRQARIATLAGAIVLNALCEDQILETPDLIFFGRLGGRELPARTAGQRPQAGFR